MNSKLGMHAALGLALICCCFSAAAIDNPHAKADEMEVMIDSIPTGPIEDGVLLQCGEIKISSATVEMAEKAYIEAEKRKNPKFVLTNEIKSYVRRRLAFKILSKRLQQKYADENKMVLPPEKLEQNFQIFLQMLKKDNTTYEKWLADNGLTDEEFRKQLKASLTLEEHIASNIKQAEVDQMFELHKDEIPLRRAAHILVTYKGVELANNKATRTKEEAKAAADELHKQLKAGGNFEEVCKKSSDCPTAPKGGDIDYFPRRDVMPEEFAKAAYALEKIGDLSGVVETKFGFHIIKLIDEQKTDAVKVMLRKKILTEKFSKRMQQILGENIPSARFNEKML